MQLTLADRTGRTLAWCFPKEGREAVFSVVATGEAYYFGVSPDGFYETTILTKLRDPMKLIYGQEVTMAPVVVKRALLEEQTA